jgi:hypothetical protein
MGPKFDNLILLDSGELEVKGPFETNGRVLDHVVIRFLIIADDKQTIFGTATIDQDALRPDDPGRGITSGTFSAIVPNPGLRPNEHVRAIGLSVTVKDAGDDPPAFETFTWCVTVKVKKEGEEEE